MDNNTQIVQLSENEVQTLIPASADYVAADIQVSTARRFPRNLKQCKEDAIEIVTMDLATAQSCSYALPRGNKPIVGPSVHLARILAQQFGNLRAEARVVETNATQVVSRGTAWDLQKNYAVGFEVRRSIVGKGGKRFTDDMITVTGNAANAIAYRNAVFAIIPKGIVNAVYEAAQHMITGDLSDEEKLIKRRQGALRHFNDEWGINEEEVVRLCGKHTVSQIKADEIALLLSINQSLIDGDTTVEELMNPIRHEQAKDNVKNIATASAFKNVGKKKKKVADEIAEDAEAEMLEQQVNTETGEIIEKDADNADAVQEQIEF